MEAVTSGVNQTQYLTFHLAGDEYAVNILRVREIIDYETVTKVPGTPRFIRGVINLRGSVVPVIDLAPKFGLPETCVTNRTCIIIAEVDLDGEDAIMGVVTDDVSQVLDLRADDIEAPPSFGLRVKVDYLLGIGKIGQKFVLILNIDRLLSTNELLSTVSLDAYEGERGRVVDAD